MAAKKKQEQYAIITNTGYGIYAGIVESFDPKTKVAKVRACRHVAHWRGKTGGITSLAAFGICGPNADQSRIGGPVDATITNVANIFVCTPEARATIEAATQS